MGGDLRTRLAACYAGVVHDVMRSAGLAGFVLPPALRPLFPERSLAGPAFTIVGRPRLGVSAHETLLAWTGLLSQAPSGHIWVSQPNDDAAAHMGELSAETLKAKGVLGCVTDGYIRDVDFLLDIGFQCWGRGFTPRDVVGYWMPEETQVPIRIGDVTIRPGDYLFGDRDGLLCVPHEHLAAIVTEAEHAIATENKVRTAILAGADPQQAYLKYGKF